MFIMIIECSGHCNHILYEKDWCNKTGHKHILTALVSEPKDLLLGFPRGIATHRDLCKWEYHVASFLPFRCVFSILWTDYLLRLGRTWQRSWNVLNTNDTYILSNYITNASNKIPRGICQLDFRSIVPVFHLNYPYNIFFIQNRN